VGDPSLTVLAGTNGAGKSSVGGEWLSQAGGTYYNPDMAAREIREANSGMTLEAANGHAWNEGFRQLEEAIRHREDFAFETTLGGETITATLERALDEGMDVSIWYVGLEGVDLHIARVRERVGKGGHPIPEEAIRRRYDASRRNLIRLMGRLAALKVFDNSGPADPDQGEAPNPTLILYLRKGKILAPDETALARTPDWAKPIVEAALALQEGRK
jgi:predicted ABC-type ATPase